MPNSFGLCYLLSATHTIAQPVATSVQQAFVRNKRDHEKTLLQSLLRRRGCAGLLRFNRPAPNHSTTLEPFYVRGIAFTCAK